MKLVEGGNIWPDETEDFDHAIIPDMMKQINSVLSKTGTKALPIGSGATPTPGRRSGDLDMIADAGKLANFFKVNDAKEARIELEKLFQQAGFDTRRTGTIVHVKTKIGNAAQQVDIMVVNDGETAQKFHVHNIPTGSQYKGVHKQIMMAALAKEQNLLWSPYEGLFSRNDAGKKDKFVTNDIDEVAKRLLGDGAKGTDLGSVESMLEKLPKDRADNIMQKLNQDPAWQKSLQKESAELFRIKQLSGLV